MARRIWTLAVVLLAATAATVVTPDAMADAGIEAQVMAKIRSTRPLTAHNGLLAVARSHSMYMSRRGGMNHDNADSRIRNAPADPPEANGGPDDGQPVAAWCENVTYSTGHPASEVAGRLYSQWLNSGPHARCMRDTSRNVGAVGVYYDGSTWWATFIATVDNTPPGGSAPTSGGGTSGGGANTEKPTATTAPKPQPESQPSSSGPGVEASSDGDDPTTGASSDGGAGTEAGSATGGTAQDTDGTTDPDASAAPELERPSIVVDSPGTAIGEDARTDTVPLAPVNERAPGYDWPEYSALAAVLVIAALMLTRRVRSMEAERALHALRGSVEPADVLVPGFGPELDLDGGALPRFDGLVDVEPLHGERVSGVTLVR